MRETAHEEDSGKPLTLRDKLAIGRTALANERTLLAYARTGLAVVIVGGSLIKFFNSFTSTLLGWLFVAAGVLTAAIGSSRYLSMRRRLHTLNRPETLESDD